MTTILTTDTGNNTNSSSAVTGDVAEVQLFALIYDAMVRQDSEEFKYWMIATFLLFLFAGFVSMVSL